MGWFLERAGVRFLFSIPLRDGKCIPVYLHTFFVVFQFFISFFLLAFDVFFVSLHTKK